MIFDFRITDHGGKWIFGAALIYEPFKCNDCETTHRKFCLEIALGAISIGMIAIL